MTCGECVHYSPGPGSPLCGLCRAPVTMHHAGLVSVASHEAAARCPAFRTPAQARMEKAAGKMLEALRWALYLLGDDDDRKAIDPQRCPWSPRRANAVPEKLRAAIRATEEG